MTFCKKGLRLGLPLMLASCASPPSHPASTPIPMATGVTDPLCASLSIVALSHADTDLTKRQVIANNAVLSKVCAK